MSNDLAEIAALPCANPDNEKGRTVWQWPLPDGRQVSYYRRRAGTVAGGHFHTGSDPSKKPERFLLLSGRMKVRMISRHRQEYIEMLDATDGPVELILHPYVLHYFTLETDVEYIEYRVTRFNPECPDVHDEIEFYSTVAGKM